MKLLVTGGTTFVSRFTAEYFSGKGHDVTVLNRGSKEQVDGVTLLRADRTQLGDTLRGRHFDAVLDITAYTAEHVAALLDAGVTFDDYILVSSSAVYPETAPQPFREEEPCGPNAYWGDYGTNKIKAEEELRRRCPEAYILRPPYFYGLYDNLYREAFVFDCAMRCMPFYLPEDGEMKLQFFHVADFCRFVELLLTKRPAQRVFNVGNPASVTVREWASLCYEAAGKQASFVSVPEEQPRWAYFCFRDYEYRLDVSRQTALMSDTLPLAEGLREEYLWYRGHTGSITNRKPYLEWIAQHLAGQGKELC